MARTQERVLEAESGPSQQPGKKAGTVVLQPIQLVTEFCQLHVQTWKQVFPGIQWT